ncbi:PulJ/GspJ family protein [Sporanaerobacter acetigenes]|uniref:Prepilin-type N-terminal cleavage/methylation domain-containing protein n=1 Tax=Sporanaerobacter acetigenes DSM 13106 TaxID=1123281 RepID=A0A1M5TWK8_9FIRM|nr:prepilin-type N-terminal cleavage/methylation domain-containing protein [Sporanaerobacter acetigenes]SHH55109.1 prepilin-type N-terminal cleavage/methylation domain-containing protein [Sporanaerobacter acetigenes DSM 13106]
MKKLLKNKKGITLVELLVTIALIGIVLSIIYNMFFISAKNYENMSNKVELNRDIRYFLIKIQKEISQARKANDSYIDENESKGKEGPIFIKAQKFCIYVDLDSDGKPELVQYYLENGNLMRKQVKSTDEKYPYLNFINFTESKVVLKNLDEGQKIEDIFKDIKIIDKESKNRQEYEETRKSVNLNFKIKGNAYEYYFFTKSKVEFE